MAALSGYGYVKEVLSGDTVVVIGQPKSGPPPELKLTLASLQSPRLALKPTTMSASSVTTKDQDPFAWESREFLRKLCIGKRVYFKVDYTVQGIGRQFGSVYILEEEPDSLFTGGTKARRGENVGLIMAREGWCTVKNAKDDSEKSPDFDQLIALSQQAEEQGKGLFNKAAAQKSVRTVKWDFVSPKEASDSGSEVMQFYKKFENKQQRAIIEYIRDGSSMKALLLESMTLVTFNLAGVQCPRMNAKSDSSADPQEYAQEAKFFTEVRLLNREVTLIIGGVSEKFATFFGTVKNDTNNLNIAVELVRNGLAQPADWSMGYTDTSSAASIHSALLTAKNSKLRLWKSYQPPEIPGERKFSGIVCEIISGDSLVVKVGSPQDMVLQPWVCEERKVYLSSIRAPRQNRDEPDEPFARESKEYLRSQTIGKRVTVEIEYAVEGQGNQQTRKYGTVILQDKKKTINVAVMMLEAGLATLIGHRQGAERSNFYHELIEAEHMAQQDNKNLWDNVAKEKIEKEGVKAPLELTTAALAKANLGNLKNDNYERRVKGIVEYVFNGSRLKVLVPSENVVIALNLSGVQSGKTGSRDSKSKDPNDKLFGEEALAFTKALVFQKDIEMLIESVDKGGNFIGTVFVKFNSNIPSAPVVAGTDANGSAGSYASKFAGSAVSAVPVQTSSGVAKEENLAILLIRYGLARTNPIGIRFAKYSADMVSQEEQAKQSKVGLWLHYVEPVEEAPVEKIDAPTTPTGKKMETLSVDVCHINNANDFFVHVKKDESKMKAIAEKLEQVSEKLGLKPLGSVPEGIKKGDKVVALFNDGTSPKWYRAEVLAIVKDEESNETKYQIRYLDFGNEEETPGEKLSKNVDDSMFEQGALAYQSSLAFVTAPELSEEFGRDAAMYLSQLTRGKTLEAKLHSKEKGGNLLLTLLPAGVTMKKEKESKPESEKESAEEKGTEETEAKDEEKELVTIGGLMLKEGIATMGRKVRPYLRNVEEEAKIIAYLKAQQDFAHQNRVNMWRYGDPRHEDDDQRF